MRRWLRPFWVLLALLFLLEAWLWEHLEPLVARLVSLVPWGRVKDWLRAALAKLPPWAALIVFVIPFIVLLPLKFLEVWLLATQQWIAAALVLVLAKLLGLGVTAFIFEVTRDKLLQMPWFRRFYEWVLWLRDWAHAQTAPIKARLKQYLWFMRGDRAGRFYRRWLRMRRRTQRA